MEVLSASLKSDIHDGSAKDHLSFLFWPYLFKACSHGSPLQAPWPQEINTVMKMFTRTRSQKAINFQAGFKTLTASSKPPEPETPETLPTEIKVL